MRMYDIIQKKRDGGTLSKEEIFFFVDGYTDGSIPDYQASALMMAIYFQGMNDEETVMLTEAMAASGDQMDLSCFGDLSVDKHSTGGVGDKTSLIVGPIVASLGAKVSKMSGRGLGHTGGTVDKLEAIPGYNTTLTPNEFQSQVEKLGIAIIGQSGNLTPADKKLYALRDVTATVDSIPLITSSIMSKKLAAGSHNIVLDVKVGSGAFMKTPEMAETLARSMVDIGKKCGRNMAALITNMDAPLGSAVGNALEVKEAVAILKGEKQGDLYEVCKQLSTQMIALTFNLDEQEAERKVEQAISSGAAFEKMKEWISAQGGDISYLEDLSRFPQCQYQYEVKVLEDGFISAIDAEKIGLCSVALGAGRATKTDTIDHSAGLLLHKNLGDAVAKDETVCTLYSNRPNFDLCKQLVLQAIKVSAEPVETKPLIFGKIL